MMTWKSTLKGQYKSSAMTFCTTLGHISLYIIERPVDSFGRPMKMWIVKKATGTSTKSYETVLKSFRNLPVVKDWVDQDYAKYPNLTDYDRAMRASK